MPDELKADTNNLPPGMDWQTFAAAVRGTGYPLQTFATRALRDRGYWVQEEWAYTDEDEGRRRAVDLFAGRGGEPLEGEAGSCSVSLELVVECKRSRHPLVLFESASPPSLRDYPQAIYNPARIMLQPETSSGGNWGAPVSLGIALDLFKLPFVEGPPMAASLSIAKPNGKKVEMSGDEAYRELLLPLTKALRQYRQLRRHEAQPQGQAQFLDLGLAVALIDAPMFLTTGVRSDPEPVDWVRVYVRSPIDAKRDKWSSAPIDFIEVVRKDAFECWIDHDLAAFRSEVEQRVRDHLEVVLTGNARISGLEQGEVLDDGVLQRIIPSR